MKKILAMSFLIVGCGTIYDTRYSYLPPRNGQGMHCISNCEDSRSMCRDLENMRSDQCEERAKYEVEMCEYRYERSGRNPGWFDCPRPSCSSDEARCDTIYNSCYRGCGGDVEEETVCVANCDGWNCANP